MDSCSVSPIIRSKFLRTLALVVASPVEGKDSSTVARSILGLLQRAVGKHTDDLIFSQTALECMRLCAASLHGIGKANLETVRVVAIDNEDVRDEIDTEPMESNIVAAQELEEHENANQVSAQSAKRMHVEKYSEEPVVTTPLTSTLSALSRTTDATFGVVTRTLISNTVDNDDSDSDIPEIV